MIVGRAGGFSGRLGSFRANSACSPGTGAMNSAHPAVLSAHIASTHHRQSICLIMPRSLSCEWIFKLCLQKYIAARMFSMSKTHFDEKQLLKRLVWSVREFAGRT
ncbi:MAG: hypothetical protein M0R76_13945 [Proteobacteria bacterium]|nr:hypothetical protein [Pseudomonadota bacterium]